MSITVRRDGITSTRHIVKIRAHEIPIDAAQSAGGKDAGPQPHDLYDASLGACKALTVLVYAQRKGIPVEDIEVIVDRDDSLERQGTYRLDTSLRVTGNLSDEQRSELAARRGQVPAASADDRGQDGNRDPAGLKGEGRRGASRPPLR